tara:strand:- start:213 stop:1538 length:1326 start_codon:yes stop_codon:yes gene_type:complete
MKNTFVISCPLDTYSGYGARARDIVKAIIELNKYDVKILSQRWGMLPFGFLDDHEEWSYLKDYILPNNQMSQQPDIWMQITVPNEFQPVGKYNIGCTAAIETTACHISWLEGCNKMDLNLVSSKHGKTVLTTTVYNKVDDQTKQTVGQIKVEKPVEVLFEGADIKKYKPLSSQEIDLDLSYIKENFCYLFVGHWMKGNFGEDRKNVGLLVKSFYETFKNKKKTPSLILKTSQAGSSYMDRREIMVKINELKKSVNANRLPSVYLLHGDLSDQEMNELYNHPKIKAMACLTKGEGFGRPLLEFSLVNKPIITTNWSGHIDFLNKEFTTLINGEVKQIHKSAVIKDMLIPESGWFSPNHAEIHHYYTDIFENYKKYKENAKRQGYKSRNEFSFEKMKEKVDKIFKQYVPEVAQQVQLQLPKLKKIGSSNPPNIPKLNLPKLKK